MAATREQIYAALWALTAPLGPTEDGGDGTFRYRSRRLKHPQSVESAQFPGLFQIQEGEQFTPLTGTPPIRVLKAAWVFYTDKGESDSVIPSTAINGLLDSLEALLIPDPGKDAVTLGGVAAYARLAGNLEIDEAVLGPLTISVLHIEVLVPEGFTC